jgi:hypothetical protein
MSKTIWVRPAKGRSPRNPLREFRPYATEGEAVDDCIAVRRQINAGDLIETTERLSKKTTSPAAKKAAMTAKED